MAIKERFTKWYVRRGYIFHYTFNTETVFECPFWVKPLLIFFSPSVYFREAVGKAIANILIEGINRTIC